MSGPQSKDPLDIAYYFGKIGLILIVAYFILTQIIGLLMYWNLVIIIVILIGLFIKKYYD